MARLHVSRCPSVISGRLPAVPLARRREVVEHLLCRRHRKAYTVRFLARQRVPRILEVDLPVLRLGLPPDKPRPEHVCVQHHSHEGHEHRQEGRSEWIPRPEGVLDQGTPVGGDPVEHGVRSIQRPEVRLDRSVVLRDDRNDRSASRRRHTLACIYRAVSSMQPTIARP